MTDQTSTLDGARAYAAHHADVDDRTPSAGDLAEDAYFDDLARRHLDAAIGQHFASIYQDHTKETP